MGRWLFQGFTEIQNGRHRFTSYFFVNEKTEKLKSVRIYIVQSHYPPSGNAHVILLKFKMAATNRLFKYL